MDMSLHLGYQEANPFIQSTIYEAFSLLFFVQALYLLSIILVNPFGSTRGEIWTQPKIAMLAVVCAYNLQLLWESRESVSFGKKWWIVAIAFLIFLGDCLISSLLSDAGFLRSLLGHPTHLSGLIYWGLIAIFTLTNSLVLQVKPELLKQQLQGLIAGGVVLALSTIPQSLDWTIDYTIRSGELYNNNILLSSIFRGHQPIGLYSHRGHAAFVLASAAAAVLGGWKSKIINSNFLLALIPIVAALLLTQTRAGILALLGAVLFLVGNKRVVCISAIASLLLITMISFTRSMPELSLVNQITSDRIWIWELSKRAIYQHPYFGYGMDGFTIAYPQIKSIDKRIIPTPYTKSHNLILDWAVSTGIPGLILYLSVFGYCLISVIKSKFSPLAGVAIAYLIYTSTWFESGQFSHIAWWALSLFNYEKIEKTIDNSTAVSHSEASTSLESRV